MRRALLAAYQVAVVALWLAGNAALAISPPLLFGLPGWIFPGVSIDANFASGQYYGTWLSKLTVSRASVEYELCGSTLYGPFAANTPALTPCGLGIWQEPRTNSYYNSLMVGGSAGVPPTSASIYSQSGLTETVGAPFVANGVTWLPITLTGTANASGIINLVSFNNTTTTPAVYGQTWSMSALYYQTGTLPTTAGIYFELSERNSGGSSVSGQYPSLVPVTPGVPTIITESATLQSPSTAYLLGRFDAVSVNTQTYSGTMYFGVPQLELNPNLPASVASAVMAASGSGGVNGSGVYTVSGGTCATPPTLNVTWAAGVLTVNGVATAGGCSVLPPSPATLTYLSGAATGWTGATVTLTPTNNAASAFSSGPILTSSGPVTRAATLASLPVPAMSGPSSIRVAFTPASPVSPPSSVEQWLRISDGPFNDGLLYYRPVSSGAAVCRGPNSSTQAFAFPSAASPAGVPAVGSAYFAPGSKCVGATGKTQASVSAAAESISSPLIIAYLGGNGVISRITVSPNSLAGE